MIQQADNNNIVKGKNILNAAERNADEGQTQVKSKSASSGRKSAEQQQTNKQMERSGLMRTFEARLIYEGMSTSNGFKALPKKEQRVANTKPPDAGGGTRINR